MNGLIKPRFQILQLLYKIHGKYQNTFIFIAHDEQLCQAICDRILILENGQFTREIQDLAEATVFKGISNKGENCETNI